MVARMIAPVLTVLALMAVDLNASTDGPRCGEKELLSSPQDQQADLRARMEKYWKYVSDIQPQDTNSLVDGHYVMRGIPQNHQVFRLNPTQVSALTFRHYTNMETLEKILSSGELVVGRTAFIEHHFIYTDVRGVFMTLPSMERHLVGLDPDTIAWVDVKVDENFPVIHLNRFFNVYLIPGVGAAPDWMKTRYKDHPELDTSDATKPFQIFDWKAMRVPVQIVGVSRHPYHDYSGATLDEILRRQDSQSGWDLLGYLMQDPELKALYQGPIGANEGSVLSHTGRVFENFFVQYPFYSSKLRTPALDKNRVFEFFKAMIALHDIGKYPAIVAGNKGRQHEFTLPVLRRLMTKLNFNADEIRLAETLVGNDVVGEMLNPKLGLSPEMAYSRLQALARTAGVPPSDFIRLQLLLYIVDAGSYSALRIEDFVESDNGKLTPKSTKYARLLELSGLSGE